MPPQTFLGRQDEGQGLLLTSVTMVRGAGLGDLLKIPASPPVFSWNTSEIETLALTHYPQQKQTNKQTKACDWRSVMQQSAPLMWLLPTGSPHWQTSDSWPRLSWIPEQRGNDDISRNDQWWQRGNLVHDSGPSAHLVCESALCWLLALLKHATEDTFLLAGDIKTMSENSFYLNTFWSLHCSLSEGPFTQFYWVATLVPLFSERASLLAVSSFTPSLSYNQTFSTQFI